MKHVEQVENSKIWFRKHVAKMDGDWLLWKRPDSSIYRIDYGIRAGRLLVTGDVGDAVYAWSMADLTFEFLSKTDLGYFESKCVASERGRKYETWDSEACQREFKAWLQAEMEEDRDIAGDIESGYELCTGSRDEWMMFIDRNRDELAADSEVLSGIAEMGLVTDPRLIAHWVGIQMAVEQLKSAK